MPLPRSSHPGNRTTKNPNLSCKGPAAGTRTQIFCSAGGGGRLPGQAAALSIRPRRALFCMTASGMSLVPASASRVWPWKAQAGPVMPLAAWTHPGYAIIKLGPPWLCHYQRGLTPVMQLPAWAHPDYATTSVSSPRLCHYHGQATLVTVPPRIQM